MGGRHVRRPLLRDQLDGRRRAWRTSSPGSPPAWTWSSSTPACTSRRRCKVRDTVARTHAVNVRSIRPRLTVGQQDGEYGPRLFARNPDECCFAAQGGAAGAGAGRLRRVGRRAAPRRVADPGEHAGGGTSTRSAARSRSTRSRRGPRRTWTPTSPGGTSRSTSCSSRATARSAAGRAPGGPRRARTRGPAAGRCSTRPNAACTCDRRGHGR